MTSLARHTNDRVDHGIKILRSRHTSELILRPYDQATAFFRHKPTAAHQIGIGTAHGVVVNLQAACQFAYAGQSLSRLKLLGRNQKDDLPRDLYADGHVALLADANLHFQNAKSDSGTGF